MSKTLCKSGKMPQAEKAKFSCKRCGAEAHKKKNLCKPKKIS